ncbi:prephenate dehydrogenase/arogenate dehydrogenase family protein [Rhodococcus sp. IEGM 1381]|uniref:prephenate dehydrogenase dimerization domain-containing protein n=1 Tax=Rhodococcus sp. IEGM 1381 TaxID=3047085 RepID=UPI0024B794D5|nr:prephenate dehydrogenase dimerization domain-containing protein [Rhodococcus sp. IEGM 1381]MDI9897093.1 prephenate dehydrogenase/arogenate dehydrogenase family protein [Rhodococcus sp. IEGM 1381]
MNAVRQSESDGSVVVVGGSGAVGRLMVDLLRGDGVPVTVVDLSGSPDAGSAVTVGNITAPDERLGSILASAVTVILAVPESVALAADLSALRPDALLVETLSVKSGFSRHVDAIDRPGATVGINPMFAPSLGMAGRPVAVVVHREGPLAQAFLDGVARWGGRVVLLDAARHDRLAAATQALTHASVLAFGLALAELDLPFADIDAVAPPPHATMLAMLARITGGEPEVYWDVQAGNPHAAEARAALRRATQTLNETVDSGSEAQFARLLTEAESALDGSGDRYRAVCAEMFGIVLGNSGNR